MQKVALSIIRKTIQVVKNGAFKGISKGCLGATKKVGLHFAPRPNVDTAVFTTRSIPNFISRIKKLSQPNFESKGLGTLFSQKFKPARRFNEAGDRVTTIIDKLTGEPVEMIVKPNKYGYKFYVKNSKGLEDRVGHIDITVDKELGKVYIDGMQSIFKDFYGGVGLRAHQLAVEEAILNDCKYVELESIPRAIGFHKKSLFRIADSTKFHKAEFEEIFSRIAEENNVPLNEIKKCLKYKEKGKYVTLASKSMENLFNKGYLKSNSPMMKLDGECFSLWKDMCSSQPILL